MTIKISDFSDETLVGFLSHLRDKLYQEGISEVQQASIIDDMDAIWQELRRRDPMG